MALIALEGMRFYAYHGFYPEEQIIGSEYIVDIHIDANTKVAEATDDLYKTVNYETVYLICQAEMRKPTKLLEALVQRILSKIDNIFGRDIKGIKVRIKKMSPSLRGRIDCSFVEIDNLGGGSKRGGGASIGNDSFESDIADFDFSPQNSVIPDFGAPEEDLDMDDGVDFDGLEALLADEEDFDDMDFDGLEDLDDFSDLDL